MTSAVMATALFGTGYLQSKTESKESRVKTRLSF
jgi:hypothetical protein